MSPPAAVAGALWRLVVLPLLLLSQALCVSGVGKLKHKGIIANADRGSGVKTDARILSGSPASKVTLMLEEMKAKSEALKDEADKQHVEEQTTCTNSMGTADSELYALAIQIGTLEAAVQQLDVDIRQGDEQVQEYKVDIEMYSQDLEIQKQQHVELSNGFARNLAEYDMAIESAERAKLILQAQQPAARPDGSTDALTSFLAVARRTFKAAAGSAASRAAALLPLPGSYHGGSAFLRHAAASKLDAAAPAVTASLAQQQRNLYTPDDGGMAKDEHLFDEFDNIASATGSYATQASTLEGIVDNVILLFHGYRNALVETQKTTKEDYENATTQFKQQLETSRSSLALAVEAVAGNRATLATKQQELADAVTSNATTAAYRQKLERNCAEKQEDYEELNQLRVDEIKALTKAVDVLNDMVSAVAAAEVGSDELTLLRLRTGSSSALRSFRAAMPPEEEQKVLGFLRVQAQKLDSTSLGQLATKMEVLVDSGGSAAVASTLNPVHEDALDKVKDMIWDLITKLQAEAAAEAGHSEWCRGELQKNKLAQETANADIKQHSAKVEQLEATIAKLALEIDQLNQTLTTGAADRIAIIEERSQSSQENLAAIEDAQTSADAVEAALFIIEEYYRNASKALSLITRRVQRNTTNATQENVTQETVTAPSELPSKAAVAGPLLAESHGVLAMLEVVRDGYKTIVNETQQKEAEEAAQFTLALQDHDVKIVASQKDLDFKQELNQTYTTNLADSRTDLNTSTQALEDAETTYEQLKPPCIEGETLEERIAKREAEIAALQEALAMMDQFAQEMGYTSAASAAAASLMQAKRNKQGPAGAGGTERPRGATGGSSKATAAGPLAAVATARSTVARSAVVGQAQAGGGTKGNHIATKSAAVGARTRAKEDPAEEDSLQIVANLLASIRDEVSADLAADKKVYEDTQSWCETTIAAAQAAVQAATERETELMTKIETSTQGKASLEVQIERLKQELAQERNSLEQQAAIRQDQLEKFHENEKELLQSVYALQHTLEVLKSRYEYNNSSEPDLGAAREELEQDKEELYSNTSLATSLVNLAGEVRKALKMLPAEESNAVISPAENGVLQEFLTKPQTLKLTFQEKHATLTEVRSQMGVEPVDGRQIYGILQQLLETFQEDLQAARDRDSQQNASFAELAETKSTQVDALVNSITLKEDQLAEYTTNIASAKEEIAYVRASRTAELEHLMSTQAYCSSMETEFVVRNSTRSSELNSLEQALVIFGPGSNVAETDSVIGDNIISFKLRGGKALHLPAVAASRLEAHPLLPHIIAASAKPKPKARPESVVDAYLRMHHAGHSEPGRGTSGPATSAALATRATAVRAMRRKVEHAFAGRPVVPVPHAMLHVAVPAARQRALGGPSLAAPAAMQVAAVLVAHSIGQPSHSGHQQLTALSTRSQLRRKEDPSTVTATANGALDQLSAMVDRIRDTLLEEKAREVAFHDTCTSEKNQAELQLARKEHDAATFNASLQKLAIVSSEANSSIIELEAEIDKLEASLLEATQNLEEESTNYTQAIEEEEAKQAKLHQAKGILTRYYGNTAAGSAMLQRGARNSTENSTETATTTRAPRPQGFTSSKAPHQGGHGIMGILELLIEDSVKLVTSMKRTQQGGSAALSKNAEEIRQAVQDYAQQSIMLQATKADADLKLEQITSQESAVQVEIGEINDFLAIVADKCDWIMQNFAESQAARRAQIDNLLKAKEAFRGAIIESF